MDPSILLHVSTQRSHCDSDDGGTMAQAVRRCCGHVRDGRADWMVQQPQRLLRPHAQRILFSDRV
jgi:hypothetical protein